MRKFVNVEWVFNDVNFGIAVRERRLQLGMSQRELGACLGYQGSYISNIECARKESGLSLMDFVKLCNRLELHTYEFFDTEETSAGTDILSGWEL